MPHKTTLILIVLGIATMIGTEIFRSVVHRRRERLDGLGGTQDIAIWGTLIGWACFIAAFISAFF
jgi:hypothetical protein